MDSSQWNLVRFLKKSWISIFFYKSEKIEIIILYFKNTILREIIFDQKIYS